MGIVVGIIAVVIVSIISIDFNNKWKEIQKDVEYKEKMKIEFIGFSIFLIMFYIGYLFASSGIDKYSNVASQNSLAMLTALKIMFIVGMIQMLIFLIILCKTELIKSLGDPNDSDT